MKILHVDFKKILNQQYIFLLISFSITFLSFHELSDTLVSVLDGWVSESPCFTQMVAFTELSGCWCAHSKPLLCYLQVLTVIWGGGMENQKIRKLCIGWFSIYWVCASIWDCPQKGNSLHGLTSRWNTRHLKLNRKVVKNTQLGIRPEIKSTSIVCQPSDTEHMTSLILCLFTVKMGKVKVRSPSTQCKD